MRETANAVAQSVANSGQFATQQASTSIEIWKYLFGTAFPVHLLDKENSKLANPIANAQDTNSSSGGYAAGGRPDSLGTTGGSGIAEQGPSGYSRPEEKLSAPGVMYQDSADGAKEAVIPKGFSSADDFVRFGTDTRDGLVRAGHDNVEPILQGSAVTGKSFKTGEEFYSGRVRDFDVALASPELLQRAQSLGINLRSGGTRTGH